MQQKGAHRERPFFTLKACIDLRSEWGIFTVSDEVPRSA